MIFGTGRRQMIRLSSKNQINISKIMRRIFLIAMVVMCSNISLIAQSNYTATYIDLGRQSAALYQPINKSPKARTALVVMHSHQDYMNFVGNRELAQRGYTVIATYPDSDDTIESKVLKVKSCVDYLKGSEDIDNIILLGHSGGATVMTAYQYLADNGRDGLKAKLYGEYSTKIDNLTKADGIILLDANPWFSTIMLNSLDPNVTDETTGYTSENKYTYDNEQEYMKGQQQRYNQLIYNAQERLRLIKAGEGLYADDEPFIIPGSNSMRFYNKLYSSNTKLLNHTKQKWPLIHKDGSITTDTIYSVRAPFNPSDRTELLSTAQNLTVRSFLSTYAMRVDSEYEVLPDGFKGINFTSNLTSPIGNITGIRIPSLFMGMTGSYEYLTSETIYENSPSLDKNLAFVEGAGHMFSADRGAETYNKTSYGDTMKLTFDYVDRWLNEKFIMK